MDRVASRREGENLEKIVTHNVKVLIKAGFPISLLQLHVSLSLMSITDADQFKEVGSPGLRSLSTHFGQQSSSCSAYLPPQDHQEEPNQPQLLAVQAAAYLSASPVESFRLV